MNKVHPLFLKLWAGWGLLTIVSLVLPDNHTLRAIWAIAFFAIELPAAAMKNGGMQDTLSELVQRANRSLMLRTVTLRGFNAFLFMPVVLILSWMAVGLLVLFLPAWLAYVIGALLVIGLHDHFLYPHKWG